MDLGCIRIVGIIDQFPDQLDAPRIKLFPDGDEMAFVYRNGNMIHAGRPVSPKRLDPILGLNKYIKIQLSSITKNSKKRRSNLIYETLNEIDQFPVERF